MKNPYLYIITGSSGIGKSTIIPFLKKRLPGSYDIHDFDEKLTEEVAMDKELLDSWRKETTLHWIKLAIENSQIGKSTIIIGLIYPREVMETKPEIPISFCLLDASNEKIKERLIGKRFSTADKIANLKKATGKTPEEFIKENKELVEYLRGEIKSVNGFVIDTTLSIPEQTAVKVGSWING